MLALYRYSFPGFPLYGLHGRENQDVCAQLTRVPSRFWEKNKEECDALVFNEFLGTYILIGLILVFIYAPLLYFFFCCLPNKNNGGALSRCRRCCINNGDIH